MASPLKNLISNSSRYLQSFKHFLECSTGGSQSMQNFMDNLLPDILSRTVHGKSHLNVIGLGSGSGEIDLKMFSALHRNYPHMTVDSEVVEPNPEQLRRYRDLVSQTPGLDYIKFDWNKRTIQEYEQHWREKKMTKKADLIYMFQVLYYVKDRGATINFYQSLLNKNGKLLISLVSDDSGSVKMRRTYKNELYNTGIIVSAGDIKRYLDSKRVSYQSYILPCKMDITECYTEGDENGELLLDFLTHVLHFSQSATPELKAGVKDVLRHPDCCVESNGKVILSNNYEMIVIDQLT